MRSLRSLRAERRPSQRRGQPLPLHVPLPLAFRASLPPPQHRDWERTVPDHPARTRGSSTKLGPSTPVCSDPISRLRPSGLGTHTSSKAFVNGTQETSCSKVSSSGGPYPSLLVFQFFLQMMKRRRKRTRMMTLMAPITSWLVWHDRVTYPLNPLIL